MTGVQMWGGLFTLGLVVMAGLAYAKTRLRVKRIGMVIRLKPEKVAEYKRLHEDAHPGVRDLLRQANIRNFSIFLRQLDDGQYYLFGYYEYTGADYDADMAKLAAEPRHKEWLATAGPMQSPIKGETTWAMMEEVYYNQ